MNKNEILFDHLTSIINRYELIWLSEGQHGLTAVRLPWYKTMRWKQERDGHAEERMDYQFENEIDPERRVGFAELISEVKEAGRVVSIKRATKVRSEFELYILCYTGWWYVGWKTILYET